MLTKLSLLRVLVQRRLVVGDSRFVTSLSKAKCLFRTASLLGMGKIRSDEMSLTNYQATPRDVTAGRRPQVFHDRTRKSHTFWMKLIVLRNMRSCSIVHIYTYIYIYIYEHFGSIFFLHIQVIRADSHYALRFRSVTVPSPFNLRSVRMVYVHTVRHVRSPSRTARDRRPAIISIKYAAHCHGIHFP